MARRSMFSASPTIGAVHPNQAAIVAERLRDAIEADGRGPLTDFSDEVQAAYDAYRTQMPDDVRSALFDGLDVRGHERARTSPDRRGADLAMAYNLGQVAFAGCAAYYALHRRMTAEARERLWSEGMAPTLALLASGRVTDAEIRERGDPDVMERIRELDAMGMVSRTRWGEDIVNAPHPEVERELNDPRSSMPAAVLVRRSRIPAMAAAVADADGERLLDCVLAQGELPSDEGACASAREWVKREWRDPTGLGLSYHQEMFDALARAGTVTDEDRRAAVEAYWARAPEVIARHAATPAP